MKTQHFAADRAIAAARVLAAAHVIAAARLLASARVLAAACAIAAVLAPLAACRPAPRQPEPKLLRYLAPRLVADPFVQSAAWEGYAKASGIAVEIATPENGDYARALEGATGYDLALLASTDRLGDLVASRSLRSLKGIPEAAAYRSGLPPAFASRQTDGFLPAAAYAYGFAVKSSTMKALGAHKPLDAAGFAAALRAAKAAGIVPIASGGSSPWSLLAWFDYLDIRINGADRHRLLLSGRRSFSDAGTVKTFERLGSLADAGFFGNDPGKGDWISSLEDVAAGRAAFLLIGAYFIDRLPPSMAADYDFLPFPVASGERRGELAACEGFALPASSASPAAAIRLAAAMRKVSAGDDGAAYRIVLDPAAIKAMAANPEATPIKRAEASIFAAAGTAMAGSDLALGPQAQATLAEALREIARPGGRRDYAALAKTVEDARTTANGKGGSK